MPQLPLGKYVTVAGSHPCGLWALAKPSGVRSHPNDDRPDPRALLSVRYDGKNQCYRDGEATIHLLNRLDAPTSGLVLLATDAVVAKLVRNLFEARGVAKTYHALVHGVPRRPQETWTDQLQVVKGSKGARTERGGDQAAVSLMKQVEVSSSPPARSLLELHPQTGRTHQLRVQCAERKLPIIGDATYGDFAFNREFAAKIGDKRLFLHATRIKLKLTVAGQVVTFVATAPLPEIFQQALNA